MPTDHFHIRQLFTGHALRGRAVRGLPCGLYPTSNSFRWKSAPVDSVAAKSLTYRCGQREIMVIASVFSESCRSSTAMTFVRRLLSTVIYVRGTLRSFKRDEHATGNGCATINPTHG